MLSVHTSQHLHEESVYIVYLVLMIIDMQFAILI